MQVLSAVLGHFTRGMPPLSMSAGTKVPADFWGKGGTVRYTLKGKGEEPPCCCVSLLPRLLPGNCAGRLEQVLLLLQGRWR